ncbi:MAG TPA: fibronectin type III domain-containing protein, partial [Solirubrobacteraceae bacterium]|nr:fibronectin type III domain-containing protein [Solirubrobacteraceae bacterium]
PGIGGPTQGTADSYAESVTATAATLTGGVYPNGNDTTYWWQYGPTTAYGEQTPATDAGAGTAPVAASGTLSDLLPATTYHYRLVAANSAGTTYGYDYTLTTPSADSASNDAQPASGGTGSGGSTSGSGGSTSGSGGSTSGSGGSSSGSGGSGSGAGGSTSGGQSAPATGTVSPPAGGAPAPVLAAPQPAARPATAAPQIAAAPRLTGAARAGSRLTVRGGSFRNGRLTAVWFERCARTCRAVTRGPSRTYRLTRADAGYYIRARITVSGPGGQVVAWATGERGPVGSPQAGSASLRAGARMIRGTRGHALVRVSLGTRSPAHRRAARAARGAAHRRSRTTVHVTRAGFRGPLTVWACARRGGAVWCTPPRAIDGQLTFSMALDPGEAVALIAVA